MVESGPFIEYCCELYIHHDVLNIAVMVVFLFAALLVLLTQIWSYNRIYRFMKKADTEITRLRTELELIDKRRT